MNRTRLRSLVTWALAASAVLPELSEAQTLTLPEAVDAALASHPLISSAAARLAASDEAAVAAAASRFPALASEVSLTRFQEPMIVAPLHSLDLTDPPTFDETLVQGRLGVEYTLYDGGGRGARVRRGEAMVDVAGSGLAASEMDVLHRVVAAYLGVLTARAVHDAAEARVAELESELDRVRRNLSAGTAAEVEVLRASATLQDARAARSGAEARVGLAERSLARAAGLPPSDVTQRPLAPVSVVSAGPPSPESVSPLVERARGALTAAEARLAEERAGLLPRVDVAAGVLDYGVLGRDHTLEWQAGLRLSWPIFTGGGRRALVRQARADVTAAQGELAATELRVADEVDAAATAATEADARARALQAAVAQWTEVARIERLALEAGSGVQRDLLAAQAGLFEARAGHATAINDAVLARVRLAKAQGVLDRRWITAVLEVAR